MPNLAAGLFVISASLIAYVLIGYPILLAALTRYARKPIEKRWSPRTVSVLLPVHNGERWIRAKLDSILSLDYPRDLPQILVVDDGSTDGTGAIVAEFRSAGVECVRI